jgi:hypothetical protein
MRAISYPSWFRSAALSTGTSAATAVLNTQVGSDFERIKFFSESS